MKWINWSDKHVTGNAGMDHDHKELMDLINQLADAMDSDKPKEFCSDTIDQFIERIKTNFAAEEQLMEQHGYPEAKEHMALHVMLLDDVLAFKASYDANDAVESITLLVVLDSWLNRDIAAADKPLANFIAAAC
jgi:hemerythrin-like metal-binding protein